MSADRIPLVDLALQHRGLAPGLLEAIAGLVERSEFILGGPVGRFEEAFAAFVGVTHCVGVGNGTDALELAFRSLGIGSGDEVVVPANTFVATATAVVRAGATPVLADCDPDTLLVDPADVERRLGPRTRAIAAVHLYGQMAPVESLRALTRPGALDLVEDCAQAHGARRAGVSAGAAGRVAATSFYPSKNLGAWGDGGAVLTDDDELAARVRRLRSYGAERRNHHPEVGFNTRLDALQALVLLAKLDRLAEWNEARRSAAARYDELLRPLEAVRRPGTTDRNEHVHHLYVVRVPDRDRVLARLLQAGIEAGVHYPLPLHRLEAFRFLGRGPGSFPNAERAASEILSLPLYPGISAAQQERVVAELERALAA